MAPNDGLVKVPKSLAEVTERTPSRAMAKICNFVWEVTGLVWRRTHTYQSWRQARTSPSPFSVVPLLAAQSMDLDTDLIHPSSKGAQIAPQKLSHIFNPNPKHLRILSMILLLCRRPEPFRELRNNLFSYTVEKTFLGWNSFRGWLRLPQ